MTIEFDWTEFTEKDLRRINRLKDKPEDDIYGFIIITVDKTDIYIVDVCYYKYDSRDQGFDLELYKSNSDYTHQRWITGIKDIKSATDYNRFCHRAENLIKCYLT